MKKKKTDEYIPKALREVWKWKAEVARETRGKTPAQIKKYFHDGLKSAARSIGAKVVKSPDGTCRLV